MEENSSYLKKNHMLPKREEPKVLVKDVNGFFICKLCGGYLIDATGLVECYDTYCRSCIVQFLQKNPYCPVCGVKVNSMKPLHSLRPDPIMQRLVYKTIPGLYKNELLRRIQHTGDSEMNDMVINDDDSASSKYYFDPTERISISLEYCEGDSSSSSKSSTEQGSKEAAKDIEKIDAKPAQTSYTKYLRCPVALKIRHICKFIKLKFNLKKNHEVEILYGNTKLPEYFTLMDTAYTFVYKRETPMRLYYQIFEKSLVEVPLKIENKISNDYASTKNDSTSDAPTLNSSNAVKSEVEELFKPVHSEPDCTAKNLKRKSDMSTKKCESGTADDVIELDLPEPSVKIPRISDDMFKEDTNHELNLPLTNSGSENGSNPQIATPSHDSGLFSDDCVKYEQDIEEVDEDDDDDYDDRLRISEGEAPTDKTESTGEQQVVDTSDFENGKEELKEEKRTEKRTKYRRKSKKSKHHHKHKNRHHERKKAAAREATILHSPTEDVMKLKLKLSAPETKHHKQSRRNRKKSLGNYFSYSSSSCASSVGALSPDTIRMSRADEDSQHSHGSEVSAESVDTNCSKEEPPKTPSTTEPATIKASAETEKHRSPTSKEKLLQMRAFRPKNIAVVKPEEIDRSAETKTTISTTTTTMTAITTTTVNDTNNNANKLAEIKVPVQVIEINDKPKVTTSMLRPTSSSSITVSKITAAEKMQMEQEKRMSVKADDKPSLEITIVQEPAKKCPSPATSITLADSPSMSKVNKVLPRTTKPMPPLVQLKPNEPPKPKSLSITPYSRNAPPPSPRPIKSNAIEVTKKINETLMMKKDGTKPSVTISLSGNHFSNDSHSGALDLSGGKPIPFPADHHLPNISMTQTLLHKKACGRSNGASAMSYNPMNSMSSLVDGRFMMQQDLQLSDLPYSMASPRHTLMHSPKNHKILSSPPRTTAKPQAITRPMTNKGTKTNAIPHLNQLRIVPACSTSETPLPKPGPNQSVRNIPNPSRLLHRHQPINSVGPIMSAAPVKYCETPSIMNRLVSTSCSFTNHTKGTDKCTPNITKVYLDNSNVMATK